VQIVYFMKSRLRSIRADRGRAGVYFGCHAKTPSGFIEFLE